LSRRFGLNIVWQCGQSFPLGSETVGNASDGLWLWSVLARATDSGTASMIDGELTAFMAAKLLVVSTADEWSLAPFAQALLNIDGNTGCPTLAT
jgi:hypothetical protein